MPIQTGLPWNEVRLAISLNEVDQLRTLLAQHPSMTNMPCPVNGSQEPLLHFAVSMNRIEAVQVLLSLGADPNIIHERSGETPLQASVYGASTPIMRLLLKHGADPNLNGGSHSTPAFSAVMLGKVDHLRLLVQQGAQLKKDDGTVLHTVMRLGTDPKIESNFTELVSYILSTGLDVNALDISHNSALHLACSDGFTRGVSTLLSCAKDIDVNLLNGEKKTPLMVALETTSVNEIDRLAIVKELIHHNASVSIKDRFRMSAIDIAKQRHLGSQILFELGVHPETGGDGSRGSGGTSKEAAPTQTE